MLTVTAGTPDDLQSGPEYQLAAYRHKVFIEHLGWKLPLAEAGVERDEFDRADMVYVVARDPRGNVCGCRQPPPCAAEAWELSRYSTHAVDGESLSHEESRRRFRMLLRSIVQTALSRGAKRLITFIAPTLERLSRQLGIVGPAQLIEGAPVVAMWVELDQQTCGALGLSTVADVAPRWRSRDRA